MGDFEAPHARDNNYLVQHASTTSIHCFSAKLLPSA